MVENIVSINKIINFLVHDDSIEDEEDINLFCPDSIEDEQKIIDYYVKKYCCNTPELQKTFLVEGNLEKSGAYIVDIDGFDHKISFFYAIH